MIQDMRVNDRIFLAAFFKTLSDARVNEKGNPHSNLHSASLAEF